MEFNFLRKTRLIMLCIFLWLGTIYASDARFAGMGNLSLLFQDDLHKLDLYDFAGNPAGFLKNDSLSTVAVRASGLKERWERDSLFYLTFGQAIPQKLLDYAPVESVSLYEVIPQFALVPCELIYTSRQIKETYDDWGNVMLPQAWRLQAGYAQLSRGYVGDSLSDRVRTPAIAGVFSKPISKCFDYGLSGDLFYGIYNSADNEDQATLFPIGGSGGIAYNNRSVSFGLNGEYHYPMFEFKSNTYTEKFNGHAVSPCFGSSIKFTNCIWASALNYKWVSLSGNSDGNDIGDLKISGYSTKSSILFIPTFFRLSVLGQYNRSTPTYTDDTGDKWFESIYEDYTISIGTGVKFDKMMGGFEGLYNHNLMDDKIVEETFTSSELIIKFGAELGLFKNLFVRGGYNYNQIDPDLNESDDQTIFNVVTGGLGLNLIRDTRIDIAYNYKWGKTDLDPAERITDHTIFLYFKYNLKKGEL